MIRWNLNPQLADVEAKEAMVQLWKVSREESGYEVDDISSIIISFKDKTLLKLVKHQDGHYVVDVDTDKIYRDAISDG